VFKIKVFAELFTKSDLPGADFIDKKYSGFWRQAVSV
jgi:hypothetical protein